jgi:hypothetical protein
MVAGTIDSLTEIDSSVDNYSPAFLSDEVDIKFERIYCIKLKVW